MTYLPLIAFSLLILAMLVWSGRAKRRLAVADAERAQRIGVGSEVMTTSGLHGVVVAKDDDGTVLLSIAKGVEVRWELAALRDRQSLPPQYRHDELDPPAQGDAQDGAQALSRDDPRD